MIHDYGDEVVLEVDGQTVAAPEGEPLAEVLDRLESDVAHVCYHPALGPLQTCDTCMVNVDGSLQRACSTPVRAGLRVQTATPTATAARQEAMQRILGNHDLYCTICDRNNGDCDVHNATKVTRARESKISLHPEAL